MRYAEKYSGYNWIKVCAFDKRDYEGDEEMFSGLEYHHIEETTFLINEVRKLAAILDKNNIKVE